MGLSAHPSFFCINEIEDCNGLENGPQISLKDNYNMNEIQPK